MKRIFKKKPSAELAEFIKKEKEQGREPIYEGGLDSLEEYKEHFFELRKQLAEEQQFVCCYCQQRIDIEKDATPKMKLEHFKPKNKEEYEHLQLDYNNMLAVCKGETNGKTHCDSCKGGKELEDVPNLASSDFDNFKIKYIAYKILRSSEGRKETDKWVKVRPLWEDKINNAQTEQEKNQYKNNDPLTGAKEGCLNLNHQTLMSLRYSTWRAISERIIKKCGNNWHTEKAKEFVKDLINTLQTPKDGKLQPFSQVMIDLLKKELKL